MRSLHARPRPWLRKILGTAFVGFLPALALPGTGGWLEQATMTGDWGGLRTDWKNAGIDVRAHFETESAANPSGGKYQTARYTQQLDLGVNFDLARLAGIQGGKIQVVLTDRAGRSLSADAIGNIFPVQQLYGGGQNFRLSELNYQQTLRDNHVNFQLGWSPLGDNFASNPYACYFQNNGLCGKPIGLAQDSGGARNFPVGQWGARVKVALPANVYGAVGAYLVNPRLGDSDHGWNLDFRHTGTIVPVELGWTRGQANGAFRGEYKVGTYYNSSDSPDVLSDINGSSAALTGAPFAQRRSRTGFYLVGTQSLLRESPDSVRDVSMFATFAKGDPNVAQFSHSWEIGVVCRGTFAGRHDDYLAAAFAAGQINPRLTRFQQDRDAVSPSAIGVQSFERFAEIDYSAQLTRWLALRPSLQYVIRPGATRNIPDAFVIGLDTLVTF